MGKLIWIAGYVDSGLNIVARFLANLLEQECGGFANNPGIGYAPNESSKKFYSLVCKGDPDQLSVQALAHLRPIVQARIAARVEGFQLLVTHNAILRHAGHPTINLDVTAAAIYVVRNPLDIAVSHGTRQKRPIERNIEMLETKGAIRGRTKSNVFEVTGSWSENVASWSKVPSHQLLTLKFEDLLGESLEPFERIADFLKLGTSKTAISQARKRLIAGLVATIDQGQLPGPKAKTQLELLRRQLDKQGQKYLTTDQIARIARAHHEEMKKFNYWL